MLLGFVAYGLSIYYYTYAQRIIGAARTSAYYAVAPFIGIIFSMLILGERPNWIFFVALAIMLLGTYLASTKAEAQSPYIFTPSISLCKISRNFAA